MWFRRLLSFAAILTPLAYSNAAHALLICGRDEVYDLSNFEPLPFGGEIIGVTIAEGQIVGTHFEITFTTSGNFDAANLGVTLVMPVLPDHLGFSALSFSGFEAGWSGQGTFTYSIESDALNGTMLLDGDPWATWFIEIANLNPGAGPISGNFDVWRYVFHFAACPAGDANCDASVTAADIPHFVEALLDPEGYAVNHPECSITTADVNADGHINGRDVQHFTALLD